MFPIVVLLVRLFVCSFVRLSAGYLLVFSFARLFVCSFACLFACLFVRSFVLSFVCGFVICACVL